MALTWSCHQPAIAQTPAGGVFQLERVSNDAQEIVSLYFGNTLLPSPAQVHEELVIIELSTKQNLGNYLSGLPH